MESHHTTFGLVPTQKKLVIYHQKRILNIQHYAKNETIEFKREWVMFMYLYISSILCS